MEIQKLEIKSVDPRRRSGTCFVGYLDMTFADLVARFGPPLLARSGEGKTRAEWVLGFGSFVFTIYDYCDSRPIENVRPWHVGGNIAALEGIGEILPRLGLPFSSHPPQSRK